MRKTIKCFLLFITMFFLIVLFNGSSYYKINVTGEKDLLENIIVNVRVIKDDDEIDFSKKNRKEKINTLLYKGRSYVEQFESPSFYIFYIYFNGKVGCFYGENKFLYLDENVKSNDTILNFYLKDNILYVDYIQQNDTLFSKASYVINNDIPNEKIDDSINCYR